VKIKLAKISWSTVSPSSEVRFDAPVNRYVLCTRQSVCFMHPSIGTLNPPVKHDMDSTLKRCRVFSLKAHQQSESPNVPNFPWEKSWNELRSHGNMGNESLLNPEQGNVTYTNKAETAQNIARTSFLTCFHH
jgi:hypothetical protein